MENDPQLKKLASLVEEKAKVVNITAIKDSKGIWTKHILDSLEIVNIPEIASILSTLSPCRVIDIGSGAGFPGLPLAIEFPMAKFTLVDGTRKKVEVINEFKTALELENVTAIWTRAEELPKTFSNHFDLVVSRAVSYMPKLIRTCEPFVKKGGFIAMYKGEYEEELKEGLVVAEELGLELALNHSYKIDGDEHSRCIYVFKHATT